MFATNSNSIRTFTHTVFHIEFFFHKQYCNLKFLTRKETEVARAMTYTLPPVLRADERTENHRDYNLYAENHDKKTRRLNGFQISKSFFETLRLLQISEANFNSSSFDSCEYLFRRLGAYERTLATLLSRIQEAYPQFEPVVCEQLLFILNRVTAFRVHFERTLFLALEGEGIQHYSLCINTATSETHTGPGHPKFSAGQEQIEALQCNGRFSWSEVICTFGVSENITP